MLATLDDVPVPHDAAFAVAAGQVLAVGAIEGPGQRAYLAVRGGIGAPDVLGSRATFALGGFGGHATGTLKTGDVLHLADLPPAEVEPGEPASLTCEWKLSAVYGPHGAPDFFHPDDIADLFSATYEVHFNSARTGVRLIGPTPRWARSDGGEAGLHPSNLHDNAYAVGSIDFTGDMPILLGPDGPSLGGFACPAVVAREDQWKLGQLKPGDSVRFVAAARPCDPRPPSSRALAIPRDLGSTILAVGEPGPTQAVYRRQGDDDILVEYGPMALDIAVRLRVHLLASAVADARLDGLIDLTPGIRSLQVHYDGTRVERGTVLDLLQEIERGLPPAEAVSVPSRIVHLPLSWNDPQAELAMRRYQETVRPNAPWCPSNVEFIRRINGLESEADVRRNRVRRQLPCHGPGRRLPRCAGGDADRSAPPPGHHQVQSGADLDAGERGRHRRRLHVHLRHGGSRRIPALRPHHPSLEHLAQGRAVRARAVAAALLRPSPLLSRR